MSIFTVIGDGLCQTRWKVLEASHRSQLCGCLATNNQTMKNQQNTLGKFVDDTKLGGLSRVGSLKGGEAWQGDLDRLRGDWGETSCGSQLPQGGQQAGRCWFLLSSDQQRGTKKRNKGKFRSDIRKRLFCERLVSHRNSEVVMASSLPELKHHLDNTSSQVV